MNKVIQPLSCRISDNITDLFGDITFFQDSCTDRVIHVMMNISDLI